MNLDNVDDLIKQCELSIGYLREQIEEELSKHHLSISPLVQQLHYTKIRLRDLKNAISRCGDDT